MKNCLLSVILVILVFSDGRSQYSRDVLTEPILKTDTTSIGQRIAFRNSQNDEATILKVTIPPGKSTGWHKHRFPVFAYVLKGNLTVEIENHRTLQFPVNSSFAEVINTFHNGMNNGNEDVVLIAFFMGERGKPLSIHKDSTIAK